MVDTKRSDGIQQSVMLDTDIISTLKEDVSDGYILWSDFKKAISGQVNLLKNSAFGVCSNSDGPHDVSAQITLTDITAGVATTDGAHGLSATDVGALWEFDSGDFDTEVYEITAIGDATHFTINDTTITDTGAPGTGHIVVPGVVGATTNAADGHSKTTTLEYLRIGGDITHINSGYFGAKLTKGADAAEYYNLHTRVDETFLARVRGRTVTLGCYIYSVSVGDNLKLQIEDGVTDPTIAESAFVGAGAKTWVEITQVINENVTEFTPRILCDGDTGDVGYVSPVMCVFGSSIGEGNYVQPPGEWVWNDKKIGLTNFANASLSSTDDAIINLEAQSKGMIPKGAISVSARISGSCSTTQKHIRLRKISSDGFFLRMYSQVSNVVNQVNGMVSCDSNGDIYLGIDDTFAGVYVDFNGVQVAP